LNVMNHSRKRYEQIYGLAGVDEEAEHEESIKEAGKSRASWF